MYKEAYKEEAFELLNELETALLDLEQLPEDKTLITRILRATHSIKGTGAMVGFYEVSDFTHEIEGILDFIRKGKIAVTSELIDLALSASDHIRAMLCLPDVKEESVHYRSNEIIVSLRKLAGQ